MQSIHQAAADLAALLAAASGSAFAQDEHAHAGFCAPTTKATPVLSTSDFDGDGTVTRKDIRLLRQQVRAGQYIAFFDRNADHVLDRKDIAIAMAEAGSPSTQLDRQLAAAYRGSTAYRNIRTAIRAGFVPWTPSFHGHGTHWVQRPEKGSLGYAFDPGAPEGLNYDARGHLWAVFYYSGPSPTRLNGEKYPPGDSYVPNLHAFDEGFAGDTDVWHHHNGVCFTGLNYEHPTLDASKLTFRQGLSPKQCLPASAIAKGLPVATDVKWTPQLHMLHVWLYELNRCGTFADADPDLAPNSPLLESTLPKEGGDPQAPNPAYPFAGGTLCAWLGELGQTPASCAQRK
ncbi:hypothetical protein IV454_15445 [Massilia antarctica]|uniref:EF-hand domain-containing protein n=1 Tax=Massilia antarctica TaxID=2765360 RepID=A0AA48WJC0_9BURK|nr:hypothetical protein [Massilia antarctica]QPI52753.1 hypothetical protein IV454_15445 [Massilia antarctica]